MRAFRKLFAILANKLLPTVVNISTSQTLKAPPQNSMPQLPPGSPLEDLFKNFLGPKSNTPRHVTSLGSGFIIDPSGYIVTNNHVIEDSEQITVSLQDGTQIAAKVIGRDTKTDLALLKVVPRKPLPATHFGDLFAFGRQRRHRLRHSRQYGARGDRTTASVRHRAAGLDRGAYPAGDARNRRRPGPVHHA